MEQNDLLDAKRYRFLKTANSGALVFEGHCDLIVREEKDWDVFIDNAISDLECDSRFQVGDEVLYSNINPAHDHWVKQLDYRKVEIIKVWKCRNTGCILYRCRGESRQVSTYKEECLMPYPDPVPRQLCPFGEAEVHSFAHRLMVRVSSFNSAEELLDFALTWAKLEKQESCEATVSFINEKRTYIIVSYRKKATYKHNSSVVSRDTAIQILETQF